jgi:hypothetical protein
MENAPAMAARMPGGLAFSAVFAPPVLSLVAMGGKSESSPADPLARQLDVLKRLQGRAIGVASEHFARQQEALASAGVGPRPFDRLFPDAETLTSPEIQGACRLVRTRAPLSGEPTRPQGYRCPVDAWGGPPSPRALADLTGDPRWADRTPESILYLDTETTSLAGGSGTYTFLIGLGRQDGDAFQVDQYFMEDYRDERALVAAVDAALADAGALVTYNGLTFDLPLLEARWRLARRPPRFPQLHLDLLHYARRLWRRRLPDCRLGTVEREVLGIERHSDVDGSWVPRIYFDFLRGVRPGRIVPVFDHHAQDIYSLAALAALFVHALREPHDGRLAHASDQWGLARLNEALGRRTDALARLEAAVLAARDEEFGFRLAMHLACAYKRLGRVEDAAAIWRARSAQARAGRLDPLIELAKHAEHGLKDFEMARVWARRALTLFEMEAELTRVAAGRPSDNSRPAAIERELESLRRRLARLEKRANGMKVVG